MGLDMYLYRVDRNAVEFLAVDPEHADPETYKKMKPFLHKCSIGTFTWESIREEVGYWRKANAIHAWFVENVQGGEDDCGLYEVTEAQLLDLRALCVEVLEECVMVRGKVCNGWTIENGKIVEILVDGKVVINPEAAQELLPAQSGFLFGSTDYDEYYLEDIAETVKIIDKVIASTNFDTHVIYYRSSW